MAVTIKDIAKVAGVSHSTVSRALKGHPAISAETTSRIRKLAQEMGYIPNIVAQNLLAQRTQTVGMVITSIADPFITRVVDGVESVARSAGYSVFLGCSQNNPEQEMTVVETFHRRRVDAIIVTSSRVGSLYTSQLDQIQVPIVLINNQGQGKYLYSVAVDDTQGAQLAVEHLIALGHRRIGYVGIESRPKSNRRRLEGYQTALKERGISSEPDLIFVAGEGVDFERGKKGAEILLTRQVTAAFCYNDMIAIGFVDGCRQQGVAIPEELSVVGFDDIEVASYVTPALTTIHQSRLQLGQLAMEMALDLLDGQLVFNQRLPCHLVSRQSTHKFKS